MNSGLFKININDLARAVINAVVAAGILGLGSLVSQPNFDLFTLDWSGVLHTAINAAFIALIGSLGATLGTTKDGKFFGVVKI